jgi:hypothetical protein
MSLQMERSEMKQSQELCCFPSLAMTVNIFVQLLIAILIPRGQTEVQSLGEHQKINYPTLWHGHPACP